MRIRPTHFAFASSLLFNILGIPGLIEDAKTWKAWLGISVPDWDWVNYLLVALGGLAFAYAAYPIVVKLIKQQIRNDFSDFDIPIRDAIDHLNHTTPHSFTRSSLAERSAFHALHEAMRTGKLPVIGAKGEHGFLKRISARRCKKLYPIEVVTPHGMRFHLVDKETRDKPPEPLIEHSDPLGFSGLRVRSNDLYKLWPKNQP